MLIGNLFQDLFPPPLRLIDCISILGCDIQTLRGKLHLGIILQNLNETEPEVILKYPSWTGSFPNSVLKVKNNKMIFTDGAVKLQNKFVPPKFFSTTTTAADGGFTHIHCLVVYEKITASLVEQSFGWRAKNKDYGLGFKKNTVEESLWFVPIVICLMTKSNYVDLFRNVLQILYGSLVKNAEVGRELSGALEFLNSVMFLVWESVIPPYDVEMELKIQDQVLRIPVESFTKLRHNESCISLLFDLVDTKAIIRFWEAALLNKHLFVVSSNNYLLFCILEAIKILIFPLRWDLNIIPVLNPLLSDYMGSVPPIMIGINSANMEKYNLLAKDKDDIVLNIDTGTIGDPEKLENLEGSLCSCKFSALYKKLQLLKVYQKYSKDKIYDFGLETLEDFIDDLQFLKDAREILSVENSESREEVFNEMVKKTFFGFFEQISNFEEFMDNDSNTGELMFFSEKFLDQLKTCSSECRMKEFWKNLIDASMTFQIFLDNYNKLDQSYLKRFKKIIKKKESTQPSKSILVCSELSTEKFITKFQNYNNKSNSDSPTDKFYKKILEQIFKDLETQQKEVPEGNPTINFSNLPENIGDLSIFYGEFGVLRTNKVFLSFLKPDLLDELYSECSIKNLPNVTWEEILVSLHVELKKDSNFWDLEKCLTLIMRLNGLNTKALPTYYTAMVLEKLLTSDINLFERFKSCRGRLRKIINSFLQRNNPVRTVSITSKREIVTK